MKKFIFSILLSSLIIFAFTQEDLSNSLKPQQGNFSFEVNFTPFNLGEPIDISGFRGRVFVDENLALRTGISFSNIKNEFETPANTGDDVILFDKTLEKATVFGINLGLEYHFLKSKRISPFAGFLIGYENKNSSAEYEEYYQDYIYPEPDMTYNLRTTEYDNAWRGIEYYNNQGFPYTDYIATERAYSMFSFNAVLGTDVYIVKHLYMGFEIGFGYDNLKYKEVEVKIDGQLEEKYPEGKENLTSFKVNNAIRLGVWF